MTKTYKLDSLGLEVELGKFARQANGSVWMKYGKNRILATAVASKEPKAFMGFFPLTVEYREKMSAAGKIPGGYFKREGRLSDFEILSSRFIDRPIRPLFPHFYFNEVQIVASVFSSDGCYPTDTLALIATSLALVISDIPFLTPVGAVKVGRINGEWKFNLGHEASALSDVDITVTGTADGINMVEGHCDSLSEDELIDLLFEAHKQIKLQVDWQLQIQKEVGLPKKEVETTVDWEAWEKKVKERFPKELLPGLFSEDKISRKEGTKKLKDTFFEKFVTEMEAGEVDKSVLSFLFGFVLKELLPDIIVNKKSRLDGRPFDKVRQLSMETSLLPQVHGSALFQRGETQALISATLGTGQDAQKIDPLIGILQEKTFMLHYNFPPFCTGEARPIRGVSRREIGHGYLAEKSFSNVLPTQDDFPYTIRVISDTLESNGSSSMAAVCGTTLALMDAGVPLKNMVGGVAMGLIKDSSGNFHVLTDILGTEDALGLMDFKITGSEKGVYAVQMDIKEKNGLSRELLQRALGQARDARLHIIGEMKKVLDGPRSEVSALAPRVTKIKVASDKIGLIIGPGGKNIKEIIAQTGVEIDIEDDGTVKIFSKDAKGADAAHALIKAIAGDVEVGAQFNGKVVKVFEYGLLVEIMPGKAGLIHVSAIPREHQRDFQDKFKTNTPIVVRVIEVDRSTGRIKLSAPELDKK